MTAPPAPGDRISEYVLDREVGSGGFGVVYRAHHHAFTERVVAVKIARDPAQARKLRHEGVLQEMVRHPNAVEILGLDAEHDPPYLILEYVDGETLAARLAREGALPPAEVFRIASAVLEALAHAHQQGIAHRDVKPANVLLSTEGAVKLADFGLGRLRELEQQPLLVSASLHTAGMSLAGTLPYMAPEQKAPGRKVDQRADVYAFGITLFEMLTGTRPEAGEAPSELRQGLDPRWDGLFRGCYARLEKRLASAGVVLERLRPLGAPRASSAASAKAETATLSLLDGSDRAIPLGPGPIALGASADASIRVVAPWVASAHSVLEERDGLWTIRDAGSKTGTYLLPATIPGGREPIDVVERVGRQPLRLASGMTVCLGPPTSADHVGLRFADGPRAATMTSALIDLEPMGLHGRRLGILGAALLGVGLFLLVAHAPFLGVPLIGLGCVVVFLGALMQPKREGAVKPVRHGEPAGLAHRAVALLFDIGLMGLALRFTWGGVWPFIVWIAYDGITTAAFGATAGKWLCGLTVTDARGAALRPELAMLRAAAKLLSGLAFGLGFLPAVFSPSRCALQDLVVESRVIQTSGAFEERLV